MEINLLLDKGKTGGAVVQGGEAVAAVVVALGQGHPREEMMVDGGVEEVGKECNERCTVADWADYFSFLLFSIA